MSKPRFPKQPKLLGTQFGNAQKMGGQTCDERRTEEGSGLILDFLIALDSPGTAKLYKAIRNITNFQSTINPDQRYQMDLQATAVMLGIKEEKINERLRRHCNDDVALKQEMLSWIYNLADYVVVEIQETGAEPAKHLDCLINVLARDQRLKKANENRHLWAQTPALMQ